MSFWQTKLLQPQQVGGKTLKNGLVFGPIRLNFAEGHLPGPKRIAFYAQLAKNGVGMLITEGSQILPGDYPHDWCLNLDEAGALKAYSALSQQLHQEGCVVVGQLNHYGGQGDSTVTRRPLWAPSNVQEVNSNEVPKVMTVADIAQLRAGFVAGARLLKEAGFDGVEINAGQFSLLRQFLSGLTNQRQDAYGGSLENRAKLLLEVLQEVRAVLDPKQILGLRLCGDELAPWAGITPQQAKELAAYITGHLEPDYIGVEVGSIYSTGATLGGYTQPETYVLPSATEIAKVTNIPLCVGGSLVSPQSMAKAQAFPLLELTRSLIADPDLVQKLSQDRLDELVPCILCKQGCNTEKANNPPLYCAVNPRIGTETKLPAYTKNVACSLAVAGAGPAGLMGAITALEAGCTVALYEEAGQVGGNFAKFSQHFFSPQPARLLAYFKTRLQAYKNQGKLQMFLNTTLEPQACQNYDRVLVATGAHYQPNLAYEGSAKCLSLTALLQEDFPQATQPATVAVVDELGDYATLVACSRLKAKGYKVLLLTWDNYPLTKLVAAGEFSAYYGALAEAQVVIRSASSLRYGDEAKVLIENKYTGKLEALDGVAFVVTVAPPCPNTALGNALKQTGTVYLEVGDVVAPRGFGAAIYQGYCGVNQLLSTM